MKTDKDYQINEENDTGDEHAKLILSRVVQNPDKTIDEILDDMFQGEPFLIDMALESFRELVNENLKFHRDTCIGSYFY
jgi:hypothetical protein